jgi:hypothetical protein
MSTLRRPLVVLVALICLLAACRGDAAVLETTIPEDLEPTEVVRALLEAINEGRFEDTPSITDGEQAGLLVLAEGANPTEVVEAIEDDPDAVAANFWSGFAQTLEPEFSLAEATIEAGETLEEGGEEYVAVSVVTPEAERLFYLRRNGNWKIDLMATFGHIVAERLVPRVEALLSSANSHAATVVGMLNESASSLQLAARNPDLEASAHQSLLALIERVTRAG